MPAIFIVNNRGIFPDPTLIDEDIIGNDKRKVVRREEPVFFIVNNRIMVEVGKSGKRILHQERKTASGRCNVFNPQGIDRVLAHKYSGSPPLTRMEQIAEVGIRNEELRSVRPTVAFEEINVGKFKEAAIDG